ncbi:16S rRNA (cytosine(1402)-N(4))-methyltransferase RsmH, partial [Candidatus Falkowbacteria bacterium]|nr:16S rRNA (cytosine(1402)-N(4))-methyltransferase RsmH [Candidatus Falkowbacteria bacterium]
APKGKVLGIDLDPRAIKIAKSRIGNADRLVAVQGNYKDLKNIVLQKDFKNISGILIDLGFSSMEIADPKKGFSFQIDAPLDMRYGEEGETAADILNRSREQELERIFREYGEEKFPGRIARKICEIRKDNPIDTTFKLVDAIAEVVPKKFQFGRVHFATKVFQALRIAVNHELENLTEVLPQAIRILPPGGRLAIISFHSLEDRIVKQYFKKESTDCVCPKSIPVCSCGHKAILKILNKKPIVPSEEEATNNPRSRSAKLRVAEKLK